MTMELSDFLKQERKKLIAYISDYLSQKITHDEIINYINFIFSNWDLLKISETHPYSEGEKEFWCAVWSIQHLASNDHWLDGVTQTELQILLSALKGDSALPNGYEGRRP